LSEAAIIAGLVKAPSNYSPTADAEAARGRAGVVIQSMREYEFIRPVRKAAAAPRRRAAVPTPKQNSVRYFTDRALPQLDTLIDEIVEPIDCLDDARSRPAARSADQAINANTPTQPAGSARFAGIGTAPSGRCSGGKDYVTSLYNRAHSGDADNRARRSSCCSTLPRWSRLPAESRRWWNSPVIIGGWRAA
jgi:penicillin-binding protein 1A